MSLKSQKASRRQSGFSMVELMVALVLGLFLTTAILQTFIGAKETYEFQQELSRMQENARFAMTFLSKDIRAADFWNCLDDGDQKDGPVSSILNGAGSADDFAAGLFGFNNVPVASTGYSPVFGGAGNRPDAILLQGGRGEGVKVTSGRVDVVSLGVVSALAIKENDILLVADCNNGVMFQVSSRDSSTEISHEVVSQIPGNEIRYLPKSFPSTAGALVFQAAPIRYWIRTGVSGEPALIRGTDTDPWTRGDELVEGVENMQLLFGEDLEDFGEPGYGTANYFVDADNVGDMDRVVSIQIHLVVRSLRDNMVEPGIIDYYGGPKSANDGRMRKVFVTTVALRNRLR